MDFTFHRLDQNFSSQDDISIHYHHYRKLNLECPKRTENESTGISFGFNGKLPVFAHSGNPKQIIAMGSTCPILMDTDTGKARKFEGFAHADEVKQLAVSPDGQYLLTKSDSELVIWSLANPAKVFLETGLQNTFNYYWLDNLTLASLVVTQPVPQILEPPITTSVIASKNQDLTGDDDNLDHNFYADRHYAIKLWNFTRDFHLTERCSIVLHNVTNPMSNLVIISSRLRLEEMIAYSIGSPKFILVSKLSQIKENVGRNDGILDALMLPELHLLLVISSNLVVLYAFNAKARCQRLRSTCVKGLSLTKILQGTAKRITLTDDRGTILVYDTYSLALVHQLKASSNRIISAIEGTPEAIILSDMKSRVIQLDHNTHVASIIFDGSIYQGIICCEIDPTGTIVTAGSSSGKLLHFEAKTCDLLDQISLQGHEETQICTLKYSKCHYLGLGTSNGAIFCWPTDSVEDTTRHPLKCSNKAIILLAFNESENMLAFADDDHIIGLLNAEDDNMWLLSARWRVHAKKVTGLLFDGDNHLFTIGLDRKVCQIPVRAAFKANKCSLDFDPLFMSKIGDLIAVASENQLTILNPDTLLVRKIVTFYGVPKYMYNFGARKSDVFIGTDQDLLMFSLNWPTLVPISHQSRMKHPGALKSISMSSSLDQRQCSYFIGFDSSEGIIESSTIKALTKVEIFKYLHAYKSLCIQNWQPGLQRIAQILSKNPSFSKTSKESIHVEDLALCINGLGFFPTPRQLSYITNQIRFGTLDGISDSVEIKDLCTILQSHFGR